MAKVCIISEQEVAGGYPVKDDVVIRSIRRIKQALRIAKNNTLVVSHERLAEYRKKRQDYERKLAFYALLGGAVFMLLTLIPIFTTGFSLYSAFLGVVLAFLLVFLAVMTSHVPALENMALMQDAIAAGPSQAMAAASGKTAKPIPRGKGKRKK